MSRTLSVGYWGAVGQGVARREMADVIFNGTDSRKSLGMAEVSLTIGGVDDDHLMAREWRSLTTR